MVHDEKRTRPAREYTKRILVAAGIVTAIVVFLLAIWFSVKVWLVAFAGILLAILLRAVSRPVSRVTRLPPPAAVVLVFLMLLGLFTLAGWLIAPRIAEQFTELSKRIPEAISAVRERIDAMGVGGFLPKAGQEGAETAGDAGEAITKAAAIFSGTVDALLALLLVMFIGVYVAAAPNLYVSGIVRLFPIRTRDRVREIMDELGVTLRRWLLGQLISMTVVGILIGIGLKLLGVPMALSLGIVAGLLDFIPIVGPLAAAIPAVLLAFMISPLHALYVVILFVVVNTVIESNLLVPLIQRIAVKLPPAVEITALVLGGTLFGFLGVLLATPLAATALVLIKKVYVGDILGDRELEKKEDSS